MVVNVTNRRLDMLLFLSNKRKSNLNELMREFNISRSTCKRDIEALSLEYPIYTVSGKKGGIYVVDGYYATNMYMSRDQEELIKKMSLKETGRNRELLNSLLIKFRMPEVKERKDEIEF